MPTPPFVLTLRKKIGQDPLWLSGVSGVVLDERDRVLLTLRPSGIWHVVSGILEPGEQPPSALVREIAEETGAVASVDELVSVDSGRPVVCENGDQVQFLSLTFRCSYLSGDAHLADDENLDVRWFPINDLPEMGESSAKAVERTMGHRPGSQPWLDRG